MPHTFVRIGDGGKGGLGVMMMFSAVKQIMMVEVMMFITILAGD